MSEGQERHGQWWESGPVFSTTDRGSKITTIAPGKRAGRFTTGLTIGTVFTALVWTGLAFLGYPRIFRAVHTAPAIEEMAATWWWLVLAVLAVLFMLLANLGLYGAVEERFGQQSAGFTVCVAAAGFGCFVGGALHLRLLASAIAAMPPSTPSWDRPDGVVLLLFTGSGLFGFLGAGLAAPFVLLRASRRQRTILRLRESAHRYPGQVVATDFRKQWIAGRPQFKVVIEYETPHLRGRFDTAMATQSDRVPLPGFPVLVSVGDASETLVEPDPDRPGAFDPDNSRYQQSSGGGGGA
ncbi:hypothetical protein [Glycomyces paridis]|uniref:Uncharacterized protein n=1 Tax=Glycomyces paridis TaxID=2126555 RepID=A0A4S8P0V3_9ACTN|nr:hypothetical protein [Glycomyces paridis]THV23558.1 hypothetical protein E9998_22445 [Glycomyces paridis]